MKFGEDHIQKVFRQLLDRNLTGPQLWSVITALRGPDNSDGILKRATTEVIRHKLGFTRMPIFMKNGGNSFTQNLFSVSEDSEDSVIIRKNMDYDHFSEHARNAFKAIGLKWGEVNK